MEKKLLRMVTIQLGDPLDFGDLGPGYLKGDIKKVDVCSKIITFN